MRVDIYAFLLFCIPSIALAQYTGGSGGGATSLAYIIPPPPCNNPTSGGSVGTDQSINPGASVNALTSSSLPSGFDGTLEYKWQKSTVSGTAGFSDIASSNSEGLTPGAVTQTTWFRRLSRVDCKSDWTGAASSNAVKIEILTISTAAIPEGMCPGASFGVAYFSNVTFGTGNVFTAEMSNASGSFANPVQIGTLTSTSAKGNIPVTIPVNTISGSGYRFRIKSSNPQLVADDNGIDYSIAPASPTMAATDPDAVCNGNVQISVPGLGSHISLSGGTSSSTTAPYLTVPNTLGSTTDFTFETWINLKSYGAWARIFDFGIDANTYFFLTVNHSSSGKPRFAIANGGGNAAEQRLTSTTAIPLNEWAHVAIVIEGSAGIGKMYLNGTEVASNNSMTWTPATLPETTNNYIGKSQYADDYLNAEMDEMRFWNIARTQQQIQESFNLRYPAGTPGLVSYYKFDEGVGTSSADAAVPGNQATFVNSVGWTKPATSPSGAYSTYTWSTGATTRSVSVNTSSTYTVTVTSAIGCSGTNNVVVEIEPCCTNPTSAGSIGTSQSVLYGVAASMLTSSSAASGFDGTLEYKWQKSTTSASTGFTDISGATGTTFSPGILTNTTWYRRLARVSCKADWAGAAISNVVRVQILNIYTGAIRPDLCPGAMTEIAYSSNITFNSGNMFQVQLSDANGSFAAAVTIGTLTSSDTTGSISITIPASTPIGSKYRVRITSSSPVMVASDNGVDLGVGPLDAPVLDSIRQETTCDGDVYLYASSMGSNISLDGSNDYLTVPNTLSSTNDFTFETWIYLRSYNDWARILDFGVNSTVNFFFTADAGGTSNRPRFAITTGGNPAEERLTSNTSIPLNVWTHVAISISGSTNVGKMYINGVEVASNSNMTLTPAKLPVTPNNYIGKSQYPDPYLNADLDEMRFWNVARTPSEIATYFRIRLKAGTPNLAAYFQFDEGEGLKAQDASNPANEATLVNGTKWVTPTGSPSGSYSSYLWSTEETTQDITINATGKYALTVINDIGCQSTSDSISVYVEPCCFDPSSGGTIASNQSVLYGAAAATITNSASPTGHDGILQYKWQKSVLGATTGFADIDGASGESYAPGILTVTTWYRRLSRVSCQEDWSGAAVSNVVKVDILNIFTGAIRPDLCPGAMTEIAYSSNMTFTTGNQFTVQLSDTNGSFTSPVTIGMLASTSAEGSIPVTIPTTTGIGTKYRMRITSSSPALIAADNGVDLGVGPLDAPVLDSIRLETVCEGDVFVYTSSMGSNISLDGSNDYLTVPNTLSSTTDFTFETWIYLKSYNDWARILDFGVNSTVNFFFTADAGGTSNRPRFAITTGGNPAEERLTSNTSIPLNVWTHVAISISGSTNVGKMYLNGEEVASNTNMTLTPAKLPVTPNNYIGKSQYPDPYLNADLDEMRFWNVARTPSEIATYFRIRLKPGTPNLAAYFQFDEGEGLKAQDASNPMNEATLVNGTKWITPTTSPSGSYSSYLWSTGETTSNITINETGLYGLTVINDIGCQAESEEISIYVEPCCTYPSEGGTIGSPQFLCRDMKPALIASTAGASGEVGMLQYKWQVSYKEDHSDWSDIPGATGLNYQPGPVPKTVWLRRLAKVDCFASWSGAASSNIVKLTVVPDSERFLTIESVQQPKCTPPQGCKFTVRGLPVSMWTLEQTGPVNATLTGTDNPLLLENLPDGVYRLRVADESGCIESPPFGVIVVTY